MALTSLAVTAPATLYMLTGEKLPLVIDCSNLMATGDVLSAPSVEVQSNATNETVPGSIIVGPTASSSTTVSLTISGKLFRASTTYTLVVTFTATGNTTTKTLSTQITINVIR